MVGNRFKKTKKFLAVLLLGILMIPSIVLAQATVPQGGTGTSTLPTGQVLFGNSAIRLTSDAKLFWDNINKFLGIGTSTPGTMLSIGGTGANTINISPTATSTWGSGINVLTGCLAINGVCAGTGAGIVTSVGLATPNSTLSLGGTNPVTTSGTINADLNLAHINSWSALQSFALASTTQLTLLGQLYDGANSNGTGGFVLMSRGGILAPTWVSTSSINNGITADSPLSGSGTAGSHLTLNTSGTWSGNAGTASTLAANGTNCSAGSYPLGVDAAGNSENCTVANLGTVTAVTGTWPIISSGGTTPNITFGGLSTSSQAVIGNIPYFSGVNTFANTATSSETCTSPLSCTGFSVIGTGGGAITLGTVTVAKGGTGQTSFGQGWLNSDGTTITSSTSPTVRYITATSTTATSTFGYGINVLNGCLAVNGNCTLTSGSAPGLTTQVIRNVAGSFSADASLSFTSTTGLLINAGLINLRNGICAADSCGTLGNGGSVTGNGGGASAAGAVTGAGGNAGSITFSGGLATGGANGGLGGSLTMVGGQGGITSGGNGGAAGGISTSGGLGNSNKAGGVGGTITTTGGAANGNTGGAGGSISTAGGDSGVSLAGAVGGAINTSASASFAGGSIDTSGGSTAGGSITTSNGGGSIDTTGTGSIGLGVSGTRTTLNGSASTGRTVTTPNADTTLAGLAVTETFTAPQNVASTLAVASTSPWGRLTVGTHDLAIANPAFVIASSSTGVATSTQFIVRNGRVGIATSTPGTDLSIGNTGANTINISSTATSTFGSGINVLTGCLAINGVCAGSGAGTVTGTGVAGMMSSWLTSTALQATSTGVFTNFHATSTTATSTIAGQLLLKNVLFLNTNNGAGTIGYLKADSVSGQITGFINISTGASGAGGVGGDGGSIQQYGGDAGSGVDGGGGGSTGGGGGLVTIYGGGGGTGDGGFGGAGGSFLAHGGLAGTTGVGGAGASIQGNGGNAGTTGAGGDAGLYSVSGGAGNGARAGGTGTTMNAFGGAGGGGGNGGNASSLDYRGGAGGSGAGSTGGKGGNVNASGGAGGTTGAGGAGGALNMSGAAASGATVGAAGGAISTQANGSRAGGLINTSAGASAVGGSITTANGGGSINTTSNGTSIFGLILGVATSTPWARLSVGSVDLALTTPAFVIASSSTGVATSTQFIVRGGNVGIATSSPFATLSIFGNSITIPFLIGTTTAAGASTTLYSIDQAGTEHFGGGVPVVTCAATCSLGNNASDQTGSISLAGVQTSVTVTFSTPKSSVPNCWVSDSSTAVTPAVTATSVSAITISTSISIGTGTIYYGCINGPN